MDRYKVLEEAEKAVASREKDYGSPDLNHTRQAQIATVILRGKLKPEFEISAADMMLLHLLAVKGSRLIETPEHVDSHIDIAGYAAILSEVA